MRIRPFETDSRNSFAAIHPIHFSFLVVALVGLLAFPVFAYQGIEIQSASEESGGSFGYSVSGVPDTNGDGRGDVIVGALFEDVGGINLSGRAYLFDGNTGALLHTFVSPHVTDFGRFGVAVSGVPDTNGDGRGDVVVGAQADTPVSSPNGAGRAYLFDGASGQLLHELFSPNEELQGDFGYAVSGVPDITGDGRGDVAVGARNEDPDTSPDNAGRAYIFDGSTGGLLRELSSSHEEVDGQFGQSVAGIPDVNGDNRGDVVVGAHKEDPDEGTPDNVGRAYVFDGNTGALLWDLPAPAGTGTSEFGYSVSGIPDTSGDGRGDVAVGAWHLTPEGSPGFAGRAYIYNGATGNLLHELKSTQEQGFAEFGASVSGVQDLNADGRGDVVVGAPREDRGNEPDDVGRAFVFDGATGEVLGVYMSPNAEEFGGFGTAVAGVPDTDNDGRGDVVVTAGNEDPGSSPDSAGRAYIISSQPPEIDVAPLTLPFGGQDVASGPTLNQSVVIDNLGCIAVEFTGAGIEITGPNAADFVLSTTPDVSNLTSDITREVFVAFDPSSAGPKTANLTITSNDSDEPTINVALGGTGLEQPPTPTSTFTATETPTPTETPTSTLSFTPTETSTETATATPTNTPTEGASPTPTDTPTAGASPTATETPTVDPSDTPTATHTFGPSPTPSVTPTPGGLADYDIAPDQPDGRIDARDLLEWFNEIQDGSPTRDLLFDFSRFWKMNNLQ